MRLHPGPPRVRSCERLGDRFFGELAVTSRGEDRAEDQILAGSVEVTEALHRPPVLLVHPDYAAGGGHLYLLTSRFGNEGRRRTTLRRGGLPAGQALTIMSPMTANHITGLYPRLVVSDGAAAIEFYRAGLGAEELVRYVDPAGKIVHAELRVAGAMFVLKDEGDGDPAPTTLGGTPVIVSLQVDDADAVADRLVGAGATVVYPVGDRPYGERDGRLADPFGHLWMVSQPIEDLSAVEVQRRLDGMYQS